MTKPAMREALEWADSLADARRLRMLRWSIESGYHTDYPTPPRPPVPFPITALPEPVGD